jgi:hypothetical protein
MKSIGRRHARKQNEFQGKLWEIQKEHNNLEEIRHALKENLHVKPLVRPKTPMFTVWQLKKLQKIARGERVDTRMN